MSVVWSGRYLEAVVDGRWEYVRRPGGISASVILAITDEGEAVLTEEHRAPFGRSVLGLPAGLVGDEGDGDTPAAAAERELHEEAGFAARNWRSIGEFASSPGMTSETYHFFIATGLSESGAGGGINDERIMVHRVKLAEIGPFTAAARARGCVIDGKLLSLLAFAPAGQ